VVSTGRSDAQLLDDAVWHSLAGPHAAFAEVAGEARRYPPDVSPFAALASGRSAAWTDLARLVGPGGTVALTGAHVPPPGWTVERTYDVVQMVDDAVRGAEDDEAGILTTTDVPEMLDLTARTRPGPFLPRTIELGTYLGMRRDGRLIAMAGERLHPLGWSEISAVCTDPDFQGQGLARRLMLALVAQIHARRDRAMLHVLIDNVSAIRVYDRLGFVTRRHTAMRVCRAPA